MSDIPAASNPLKVAVVGGGAVGGSITCLLSSSENLDLSLLVRSKYLDTLKSNALRLAGWPVPEFLENGEVDPTKNVVNAKAVRFVESCPEEAAKLGEQDYIIVTVKAHCLPSAIPTIKAMMGERTTIVAAQNGIPWWYCYYGQSQPGQLVNSSIQSVDPDGQLWNEIKPERVIGAVVYCAMEMTIDPSLIVNYAPNRWGFTFGEPNGETTPRLEQLASLFEGSGLSINLTNNIRAAIWTKLMGNAFFNPITALSNVTWGQLASNDRACLMGEGIMEEVLSIAQALGVDMGGMEMAERMKMFRSANIPFKSSMLQDMERGRAPEVCALLSAPLEIARQLGLGAPRLELLETLLILSAEKDARLSRRMATLAV